MIDKALFCKRTGDLKQALKVLKKAIAIESKDLGLMTKKLVSHSYVIVPIRPQVTLSNKVDYNKGDYYYTDLGLIYKRGERKRA